MKVLMTADAVGGVWTYALELAEALQRERVDVALAVMGPPPSPERREEAERLPNVTLEVGPFKLEWMEDAWHDVRRAGEWLLALEREHAPDVVHLNGFAHAALPWRAPVLAVGHSCVLSWWRAVRGGEAPASWDRYREAVARGLRAADLVVAPTTAMLASLRADYGPFARESVIPNARDPSRFRSGTKEPFVMSAGRLWDEAKNLAALDAAAADSPWPVLVAGDDAHPEGGRASARHARFLGRLPDAELRDRLARASVFALPAKYEPFGLAPLEAALSGCALVLGDLPSLREVWGEAATFTHPDDASALAAALARLAEDDALRRRQAERARERASRYTPQAQARAYTGAYRALAKMPKTAEEEHTCAS